MYILYICIPAIRFRYFFLRYFCSYVVCDCSLSLFFSFFPTTAAVNLNLQSLLN